MELGPLGEFGKKIAKTKEKTIFSRLFYRDHDFARSSRSIRLENVLEKSGRAILGSGAECVVADEGNERVLAIKYNAILDPIDSKKEFYMHKILHVLFPNNFPRFYASFAKGEDSTSYISGTIRQKINLEKETDAPSILQQLVSMIGLLKLRILKPVEYSTQQQKISDERSAVIEQKIQSESEKKSVFGNVMRSLRDTGMEVGFDTSEVNLVRDVNGNINYVDTVSGYKIDIAKKSTLLSFMKERGYSEDDAKVVSNAFDRIIALESEKQGFEVITIDTVKRKSDNKKNEEEEINKLKQEILTDSK